MKLELYHWGTFGLLTGHAAPESLATFSAFLVSMVPKTEGLLPTAEARMWKDVACRIFWYLNTLAVAL